MADPHPVPLHRVISRSFPADPKAPATARRAVDGLGGRIGDELKEDIRLLVSEIVTNSVLHGASEPSAEVELDVWVSDDVVRVAVTDQGPGFERQDRPTSGDRSGWGHDGGPAADSWGVELDSGTEGLVRDASSGLRGVRRRALPQ